jgi:hypothetical protein
VQQEQASTSKWQAAISFGATVLGALMGRKKLSAGNIGRATTAARGVGRSMKESSDVARADENVQALQQQLADLNSQLESEINAANLRFDPSAETLARTPLRPKKTDIKVRMVALAWAPYWRTTAAETPAWE